MIGGVKIDVACGGTGGHVFPGIAVAEALSRRGHDVTVWLAGKGIEGHSAAGWKGRTVTVRAVGFQGKPSPAWAIAALRLAAATVACRSRMKRHRPDALLAMGSYSSVGPALAARWLGVPVVLHEANAIPGRAVSFLSRFKVVAALAFDEARRHLPQCPVEVTGLPLKSGLEARFDEDEAWNDGLALLVMGGSQGAHALNTVCTAAVRRLHGDGVPVRAIHLAGEQDAGEVRAAYEAAGVPHRVHGFLDEMGKAYNAADLAIARAGAASCSELSVCGVPAILVPLPSSRRGHQQANAEAMAAAGAAQVMRQGDFTEERAVSLVRELWEDPGRLANMREGMLEFARPDAAERVADVVERTARQQTTEDTR